MSRGEALKAAVRRRLSLALEEVLELVQSTVQEYDRLLQTTESVSSSDKSDALSENTLPGLIKEEQETCSIQEQPASGPNADNRTRHPQKHAPQPLTKSEDSEEECPICRHQQSPRPGPNQDQDQDPDHRPGPNQEPDHNQVKGIADNEVGEKSLIQESFEQDPTKKLSKFENVVVKSEPDDGGYGYADEGVAILGQAAILEQAGEQSWRDLKRPVANQEQLTVSKFRKTSTNDVSKERQRETVESEEAESLNLENVQISLPDDKASYTESTTEEATLEYIEQEQSLENEVLDENAQNSSQNDTRKDIENSNKKFGWQKIVKKRPTVKLVQLKIVGKSCQNAENQVENTITETGTKERNQALGETTDSENEMDTDKHESSIQRKVSDKKSIMKKSGFAKRKSISMKKKSSKEMRDSNIDGTVRRPLNRKAKARASKTREKEKESESSADTDQYNDSDYKTDNTSDSENSDDYYSSITQKRAQNLNQSKNGAKNLANDESQTVQPCASKSCEPGSSQKQNSENVKLREGKHACAECGVSFTLKKNLKMHSIVHSEDRPFSCSHCDATFKRKINLKVHLSTHSGEKDFQCSVCAKKFTRKSNLDDHFKTHSGVKPYSCSVCSRAFACRSNLRRHAVSHTGLRPFDCDVCGKRFGRKSVLEEHMTAHTGEQAFSCSVCQAKFSRKHNLRKHLVIHRGERRFECRECPARFSQKAHLNQHMVGHSGEKPYSCSVCKKGFTRKAYVQQHLEMYCVGPAASEDRTDEAEEET